jgi:predicted PolB exonuclease-like 3'-5' exonuclease
MNIFAFSIKTVPDIDSSRRLYDLHGLSDEDVVKAVLHKRRQQSNTEVLSHHLQRIVSISAVLRHRDQFRVWSLGDVESNEEELLQRFFSGIDRYTPDLLSWDGNCFDFPVIHYRSLLYALNAGTYWSLGENNVSIRPVDLTQALGLFSSHEPAPLGEVAALCGFPGRARQSAIEICDNYLQGNLQQLRDDGEIDALNTFLIYLRLLCNKGQLDSASYQHECQLVREELQNSGAGHLQSFNNDWLDL